MIHVFFVPGMFGSTVEYVLRNYTQQLIPVEGAIESDGSMHSFSKQNHILNIEGLNIGTGYDICTPIYPFRDSHLPDILKSYPVNNENSYILIYAEDFASAELNILFQYHKISNGSKLWLGLNIFSAGADKSNFQLWNSSYRQASDLMPWEFREWFSIFYPNWIAEWQQSAEQVPETWLRISSKQILNNPAEAFCTIIEYCNLTLKPGIDTFATSWQAAQQYVLDEYHLVNTIVDHVVNQQSMSWKPISIIAESLIQQKLRAKGFEIRCDGLNIFPTSSLDLYNILDKNLKLHQGTK